MEIVLINKPDARLSLFLNIIQKCIIKENEKSKENKKILKFPPPNIPSIYMNMIYRY